jgi:hypothetical protein
MWAYGSDVSGPSLDHAETYDIAATADRPPSIAVATAGFPLKDALVKTIRYGVLIKTENVTDGSAGL